MIKLLATSLTDSQWLIVKHISKSPSAIDYWPLITPSTNHRGAIRQRVSKSMMCKCLKSHSLAVDPCGDSANTVDSVLIGPDMRKNTLSAHECMLSAIVERHLWETGVGQWFAYKGTANPGMPGPASGDFRTRTGRGPSQLQHRDSHNRRAQV